MDQTAPETPKPKRVVGRPWRKGQSGNPSGRTKRERTVVEIARENSPAAIRTLIEIMNDKAATPGVRATAAEKVLDRAYGRPPQVSAVAVGPVRRLSDLTDEQLLAILAGQPPELLGPVLELEVNPAGENAIAPIGGQDGENGEQSG